MDLAPVLHSQLFQSGHSLPHKGPIHRTAQWKTGENSWNAEWNGKNRRRRTTAKSELKEKVEVSQQIPRAEQGMERERRMDSDVEETKDAIRKEGIRKDAPQSTSKEEVGGDKNLK